MAVNPEFHMRVDKEWLDMVRKQAKAEERTVRALVFFIMKEYCEGRMRWKEKWE